MMDELIKAMSDEDLVDLKAKYADNASLETLIDGILETRIKEAEQAKAKAKFANGIDKFFAKLPHPDDIANVYVRWGKVVVTDGEPEEVELVVDGVKTTEMRSPSHEEDAWIVETNKGFAAIKGTTNNQPATSKKAITVYKREGVANRLIGNFRSYAEACRHEGLPCAGSLKGTDSGERVLTRNGYVYDQYDGVDFTS